MPNLTAYSLSFALPAQAASTCPLSGIQLPVAPLRSFHLSLTTLKSPLANLDVLRTQIDMNALTSLSLLNLTLSTQVLAELLSLAPNLDELYISTPSRETTASPRVFAGCKLRILHISCTEWVPRDDLVRIAEIVPGVEQIGVANRVYEVHRRLEGQKHVVELSRWSKTYTPGYFQVWRG
jgi:hypothetical protein